MPSFYSPLRYPGGKGKLAQFVKDLMTQNNLGEGTYIEPYAGGASVALHLLFESKVREIHINDFDVVIYAFWKAILDHTDDFVRKINTTPVTVDEWMKQKEVYTNPDGKEFLDLGFATFFLNRTNRSGILNAGIIGGKDQTGPYKIDARYNKKDLIKRIENISDRKNQIRIYNQDAIFFIKNTIPKISKPILVFLDPPYYVKGKDLYKNYYNHSDHIEVSKSIKSDIKNSWIVTYDNVPEISELYSEEKTFLYNLIYSATLNRSIGAEIMFHSKDLIIPYHPDPNDLEKYQQEKCP